MTDIDSLQSEVARIVESTLLARCPQQKALLNYLLVCAVRQQAPSQFDIATNALGRSDEFDETCDSSVRTHVSRLRKTLSAYYATHQPLAGSCAFIRAGEYRIRLAAPATAYPNMIMHEEAMSSGNTAAVIEPLAADLGPKTELDTAAEDAVTSTARPVHEPAAIKRRKWVVATCFGLMASLVALLAGAWRGPAAATVAFPVEVPAVAFSSDLGVGEAASPVLRSLSSAIRSELRKSIVSRFAPPGDAGAEFTVTLSGASLDQGDKAHLTLSDANGVTLALKAIRFSGDLARDRETVRSVMREIVSPAGSIAEALVSRSGREPSNSFECFLHVENHRAFSEDARALLERCVSETRGGEYWPYLQARAIFYRVQQQQAAGRETRETSDEWQEVARLVSAEPQNPYVATLAAKVLIGRGACEEARGFVVTSLARGRTYSAMELSLLVDAIGCGLPADDPEYGSNRLDQIGSLHAHQTPLGDIYLILGHLALGRRTDALVLLEAPFAHSAASHTAQLRSAIAALLRCGAQPASIAVLETELPKFIFNRQTRSQIILALQKDHADAGGEARICSTNL